jgi:hypothetical protein
MVAPLVDVFSFDHPIAVARMSIKHRIAISQTSGRPGERRTHTPCPLVSALEQMPFFNN